MRALPILLLSLLLASGCSDPSTTRVQALRTGPWHLVMDLRSDTAASPLNMPVSLTLERIEGNPVITIINGRERIAVHEVRTFGDSIHIRLPLYDAELIGTMQGDSVISGYWRNHFRGPDHRVAFRAVAGTRPRFTGKPANISINGEWKTAFERSCCEPAMGIGIFEQQGDHLEGTFATETGDYRFLEGVVSGDSLYMSVFNGTQALLMQAVLRDDTLFGTTFVGNHATTPWVAVKDPAFRLRHEDSLTYMKAGHKAVHFEFTDLDGKSVSPTDDDHRGKVVLVQILGSWCPNCVDESVLFQDMYARYHDKGLEVVGVAFERYKDDKKALAGLARFRDHLGLTYPICYAGHSDAENISEKVPFLEHIMSFPTSLMIARDGTVRHIHTGFNGPGTGERYNAYVRDLDRQIQALLQETPGTLLSSKP